MLIIAEKPIAGRKIAEILSNNKYLEKKHKKAPYFLFENKDFGKCVLVPLKGHISDVAFPEKYKKWKGTDVRQLAKNPEIQYIIKEKDIVYLLKHFGKNEKCIIIATDADREGESIGREAVKYVKEVNPNIEVKRAYFSAITKDEIQKSFKELKNLDEGIADAADARREIDLIWGAALTRFLSLIVKRLGNDFLSVGRVQSPTLAKIVEKELEIASFKAKKYWSIELLLHKDIDFKAIYEKDKIFDEELAKKIFSVLQDKAKVISLIKKKKILKKPEPFNTTDFLREASKLGYSPNKAISIAENLYMNGYISYPRTDNKDYSNLDITRILRKLEPGFKKEVEKIFSQKEIKASKGKKAKDHPPIHPVALAIKEKLSKDEWKIYKLIVDRFFATLYENAEVNTVKAKFDVNNYVFVSDGAIVSKKGWLEFYSYYKVSEKVLPELEENEIIAIKDKKLLAKETKPPNRYSLSALIKLMEDLGLGTKSTRPAIIEKLFARNYIKGKKQVSATEISKAVISALKDFAKEIVEAETTAKLEKDMGKIEEKKISKEDVVKEAKELLLRILEELFKNKDKIAKSLYSALNKTDAFGDCVCGGILKKRKSKTGKFFLGCSNYPNCKETYSLPQNNAYLYEGKCEVCNAPKIKMKKNKRYYKFCLNNNCPSKANVLDKTQKAQISSSK